MTGARSVGTCLLLAEEVWGSALHAARSVARAGGTVLVVTPAQGAAVYRRSRWCEDAIDLDPEDATGFCTAAGDWVSARVPDGPVAVIPLSDRLLQVLLDGGGSFGPRFRLCAPEEQVARHLLDKAEQLRLADRVGPPAPPWVEVSSVADLDAVAALRGPVITRPAGWADSGPDYFKLRVEPDAAAAVTSCRRLVADGARLVVQEFLRTPPDAVEFGLVWRSADGSRSMVCTGRKRRQSTPDGGVMAWGEAVLLPDVAAATLAFADAAGFRGLGGLEVIRTDDGLRFVEFNPRAEAIHFLGTAAGIDTVGAAFRDLVGTPQPPVVEQRPAAAWIGSAYVAMLANDPSSWTTVLRDRIAFAARRRRVRAVWSWDDPLPALAVVSRIVGRGARKLTRRSR